MRFKILVAAITVLCVGTQVAKADDFDLGFSGKLYVDASNINHESSDSSAFDERSFGIDVKRFYLTVNPEFDETWSVNLTTDFKYVDNDGVTNLYVKKAYLQGAFSRAAVLRVGSAGLPWIAHVESAYGFRYVENTLVDRLKFGVSADWGLHLGGSGGMFNYAISAVNGGGYKHPGRSRSIDVAVRLGVSPVQGLHIAVGSYSGKLGRDTAGVSTVHTAKRSGLMVAWVSDGLRVGGEYFRARNWNTVLNPLSDSANGYSVWGSQEFGQAYAVFARYDHADLSNELDPAANDRYFNIGLQYRVNQSIRLAAVYKQDRNERSVLTPAPMHATNTRTREIGVWGEVKF